MKHTSIFLLLLCMSFISAAQPTFSAHYVPGAGLESISATIMRNSDEWLIYTASGKLYRTTNAGAAYDFVLAFPPSTVVRKFVNVGDTIYRRGFGHHLERRFRTNMDEQACGIRRGDIR